jgi:hypothetical protein
VIESLLSQVSVEPDVHIGMTFVRQLCAWCMLSVSYAACGPTFDSDGEQWQDDPRSAAEIAQDIYETEHGALRQQCVADAKLAEFIPMPPGDLSVKCDTAMNAAVACLYQYDIHGPRFAILSTIANSKQTQVHEFMHYMLSCGAADSHAADPMHEDNVWLAFDDAAYQMHTSAERRQ